MARLINRFNDYSFNRFSCVIFIIKEANKNCAHIHPLLHKLFTHMISRKNSVLWIYALKTQDDPNFLKKIKWTHKSKFNEESTEKICILSLKDTLIIYWE